MGSGSAPVAPKKKSQVMPSPLCVLCRVPSRHFPRCTVTLPSFRHGPSPSRAQEPTTDWKLLFWVMATPFVLLVVVRTPPISESMLARSCTKLCNVARARHSRALAYTQVYSICLWIFREPIAATPCQGICEITDKLRASSPPGETIKKIKKGYCMRGAT